MAGKLISNSHNGIGERAAKSFRGGSSVRWAGSAVLTPLLAGTMQAVDKLRKGPSGLERLFVEFQDKMVRR